VIEPFPIAIGPHGVDVALHQKELEREQKEAESYLTGLQGEFCEKGIEVCARLAHGSVVQEIISAADGENADLVALASHGRSGLSQVFFGSVAVGVLHRIERPLLLIRSTGEE
jgi:nucleotide-binding universal stress UspA family protein